MTDGAETDTSRIEGGLSKGVRLKWDVGSWSVTRGVEPGEVWGILGTWV